MALTIVGAGLAGLLSANMLRHHNPTVIEAQSTLPNNHSAVLRFRTDKIGLVLNIPFKKVQMIKAPIPWRNPVADALSYSLKNTGTMRSDRSIIAGIVHEDRYIAPPNLIEQMAVPLSITFGRQFHFASAEAPAISTIPMPLLMRLLKYPNLPTFSHVSGLNIHAKIAACDAYTSILVPDPKDLFSRISITGDQMIIELPFDTTIDSDALEMIVRDASGYAGIDPKDISEVAVHKQAYAKINPIPEDIRRDFIHWASMEHNIYSLGRFATWRPSLLLDDLVRDVQLIDKWISKKDKYAVKHHEMVKA